jgi:hypothetical protein
LRTDRHLAVYGSWLARNVTRSKRAAFGGESAPARVLFVQLSNRNFTVLM